MSKHERLRIPSILFAFATILSMCGPHFKLLVTSIPRYAIRDLNNRKQNPPIEEQKNVGYQIPCQDCSWSYIGETGGSLKTRKSEHVRNVKQSKNGSNVAKHAWPWAQDHVIDFANAKVIDKGNHRNLETLESWHTTKYAILLRKELKKH
jgi:hypothetical protein